AYRENDGFTRALNERRHLVLAHGTRAATTELAMEFLREMEIIFRLRIKDLSKRLDVLQFPWLDNKRILERLEVDPMGEQSVIDKPETRKTKAKTTRKQGTKRGK